MGILSTLDHEPISIEIINEGFPPLSAKLLKKTKTAVTTDGIKRRAGRPSNLPDLNGFIIQLLKEKNKPLTSEEILTELLQEYKTLLSGSTTVKAALNQALYRLQTQKNLITRTRKFDKKENLYSLVGQAYTPNDTIDSTETYNDFPQFIIDTLHKNKRLLSLNDFLKHALIHYKIPSSDKRLLSEKISPVLSQMAKSKNKIRSFYKDGIHHKFYALNEWFNSNGELMTIY
jgi:hypothetical protein